MANLTRHADPAPVPPDTPDLEDNALVLIVDDNESMRMLFALVLKRAGLQTIEAASMHDALRILEQGRVSLVLLDQRLGPNSGLDLMRLLRSRPETATLPVILVTAHGDVEDRVSGLEAGANDFLTKPVHFDELVARVRSHLRTQRTWLRAFEAELQDRILAIQSLSDLPAHHEAEQMADVVCKELSRHPQVSAVAVLAFAGQDLATLLGASGWDPPPAVGAPVSPGLARALHEHARHGPWLERVEEHTPAAPFLTAHGTVATAFVPLLERGEIVGLLVRATRSGGAQTGAREMRHLAGTIDLAETVSGLLTRSLGHHGERMASRARIETVLSAGSFHPVFQSVVDLDSGAVVGYEALTRFEDGVGPLERFTRAAHVGMGEELEVAALKAAVREARSLPKGLWLSLNVSPALLQGSGPLAQIVSALDRPVVLELTEHDRIDDYQALRQVLADLGPHVELSVDDAGSGFASLRHVLALHPAFVKFDRSWIHGIDADPARQALVAGLAHFAAQTGCTLVAEGIETAEELRILQMLGVGLGQGFLLGVPAPLVAA